MSRKIADCAIASSYPDCYRKNGWEQLSVIDKILEDGKKYQIISVQKRCWSVAKICLVVLVTFLSLGLVFAFPTSRRQVENWWSGIEARRKFALLTDLKDEAKVVMQGAVLQECPAITLSLEPYFTMEEILKDDREHLIQQAFERKSSLMKLPADIFTKIGALLSLHDLRRFAQTSKQGCCLVSDDNNTLWNLVGSMLGIPLDLKSTKTLKEQVKNAFIELPFARVDLANNRLIMKVSQESEGVYSVFEEVWNKYLPKGYYLVNRASQVILVHDSKGKKGSMSMSRVTLMLQMGRRLYLNGEDIGSLNQFEVVPLNA